jgi:hypothetical protein
VLVQLLAADMHSVRRWCMCRAARTPAAGPSRQLLAGTHLQGASQGVTDWTEEAVLGGIKAIALRTRSCVQRLGWEIRLLDGDGWVPKKRASMVPEADAR